MNNRKNRIQVSKSGTVAGSQPWINFIEGSGATLTVADNPAQGYIDVTIATSGGGGSTFADNVFRVQDNGDATKQLAFECSGITTGTTRTWTVPNTSDTLVGLTAAQTLTNKTLTTPIIAQISNTGTLTLPTSTDTLVGRDTTDTLTNKTIGVTNTITAKDSTFTIADDGDNTKKIAFQASGITTGTTRTLTVQDVSGTVLVTGGSDVPVADGGTGVSTTPSNGQLLIGNGSGYAVANITAGSNITVTNGAGAITITGGAGSGGDFSSNTASSVDSEIVLFSGTGGKTGKRATGSGIAKLTSGVLSAVTAPSGTIVGDTDTQTLTNKSLQDSTTSVIDNSDATKIAKFECSGITTGTTRTFTFPDASTTIVGHDATQTLTNKTIGSTNTLTAKDSTFTIVDDADATKIAAFQCSGITTGTTRTYTLPNATTTLDGIDNTATLTNKTISGASNTISNLAASVLSSGQVAVARGGTGVDGSSAANGSLLIGNGTGYTLATLTAGSNITITNGAGAITITGAAGGGGGGSAYFDDDGSTPSTAPVAGSADSIAIGETAAVSATSCASAYAIGTKATVAANTPGTIVIGSNTSSGTGTTSSGDCAILLGSGDNSGANASCSANYGIVIGSNAGTVAGPSGSGPGCVVIGSKVGTGAGASTVGDGNCCVVIGSSSSTGAGPNAQGQGSILIGANRGTGTGPNNSAGDGCVIIGSKAGTSTGAGPASTSAANVVIGGTTGTGAGPSAADGAGSTKGGSIAIGGSAGGSGAGPTVQTSGGGPLVLIGGTQGNGNGPSSTANSGSGIAIGGAVSTGASAQTDGGATTAIGSNGGSGVGPKASGTASQAFGATTSSRNAALASADYSVSMGTRCVADVQGMFARGQSNISADGDMQWEQYLLFKVTTNATPANLDANGGTNGSTTAIGVGSGVAKQFIIQVVGTTSGGDTLGKVFHGVIKNTGGTTALVGSNVTDSFSSAGATSNSWDITCTADDTNDRLQIQVTGQASTTINWHAVVSICKIVA